MADALEGEPRRDTGRRASAVHKRAEITVTALTIKQRLLLIALRRWRERQIEIAGLQRVLILAQRGVMGRHRNGKAGRQAPVKQTGALQLIKPREIAQSLQGEMSQKCL